MTLQRMKMLPMALLALSPFSTSATDVASLAFPPRKIGVPPLSLSEIGKHGPVDFLADARVWFRRQSPPVRVASKLVSNMPVIVPRADVDSKMVVKPNFSIDFNLIMRIPDVEPSK